LILNYCNKDEKKLSLLSILGIFSIIIFSYLTPVEEVNAQTFNLTSEEIKFHPTEITVPPPFDVNTGQSVAVPGTVKIYTDPITGVETLVEAKSSSPDIEGWSLTTTQSIPTIDSELNTALGLASSTVSTLPEGSTIGSGLNFAGAAGLASTSVKDIKAEAAGLPTFNPPLAKCDTGKVDTAGGFDVAKYVFSGRFDKDKLKGDDFVFQVFADLVKNDGAEIEGKDAPYKANILTDDGDKNLKFSMDEIGTVCVDTQHVINVAQLEEIDLDDSPLFESLDY
jgi:hypothetical protein